MIIQAWISLLYIYLFILFIVHTFFVLLFNSIKRKRDIYKLDYNINSKLKFSFYKYLEYV